MGKKQIHTCYIWDFPLYKKDPRNDIEVVKKWAELMKLTDIVVGWNSDRFDNRVMYGRLLIHKLPPVMLPQSVDVMKAFRKIAAYDSYKLDDVSDSLGHGRKRHTDIDLWYDCVMGDLKAQKNMVTYNKRDVEITELDYIDVMPHMANHPNMALLLGKPDGCRVCGGTEFEGAGWKYTRTQKYRRFQCKNKTCRAYNASTIREPIAKTMHT